VLELGAPGLIEEVVVDTAHFKGNYPDRCFLQAAAEARGTPEEIGAASESWPVLLSEQKLEADKVHVFSGGLAALGPVRFVRLNIIPDGGVSRLRLIGRVVKEGAGL
jgi:allantoicase